MTAVSVATKVHCSTNNWWGFVTARIKKHRTIEIELKIGQQEQLVLLVIKITMLVKYIEWSANDCVNDIW